MWLCDKALTFIEHRKRLSICLIRGLMVIRGNRRQDTCPQKKLIDSKIYILKMTRVNS